MGAKYHLPFMETLKKLKRLYPKGEIPTRTPLSVVPTGGKPVTKLQGG